MSLLRHSLAAHTDALIKVADRQVSRLRGRASKQAIADRSALPALNVLLTGMRKAIKDEKHTKAERFDAIAGLVHRYDTGERQPI